MRSPGRPRRRAEPPRPAVSRRNSRRPSTSSATVRPAASLSPNTSVAEALIVPGDPSGRPTIKFKTRFSRVNPLAHNNCPNNGWVDPVTRTSHGKTSEDVAVCRHHSGTGKTHLATGLAIRACQAGHRVLFATAAQWVTLLAEAHHAGRLQTELARLGRYPLLVVDEVGYIPFEPEAANLFFQLVSSRYERASLIVTSNKVFGRWGEVFGDDVVAAAMIDRLVHHAEVIALKGDSYRLKDRDLGRIPTAAVGAEE